MINFTELRRKKRRAREAVRGGTARLTTPQAPAPAQKQNSGIIRPNTGMLKLPSSLTESNERQTFQLPGRVMLIITGLAIVFIIVIAWFVAHEPSKETKGGAANEASSETRK